MFGEPPRRKRMRLAGHDYAGGVYFVTICTIGGHPLFGDIVNGRLVPSAIGEIVEHEWKRLSPILGIVFDEYIVMPNHMHAIVAVERGSKRSLSSVIQLFKSRAVKSLQATYRDPECRIWQRSFHDDVVNGDDHLTAVRQCIRNNPSNWEADEYWWRPQT